MHRGCNIFSGQPRRPWAFRWRPARRPVTKAGPLALGRRLFVVALGAWSLSAAAAPAAELLTNPDFAAAPDGGLAAGWRDGSTALPRPAAFTALTSGGGGHAGLRVTLGPLQGGRFRLVQTVTGPAPGLYRLRAVFRAAGPMQVELVARTTPRPWIVFGSMRERLPAGVSREVVGYARIPHPPGTLDFVILLDDAGTVEITAASLQPVDEAALSPAEQARVEDVLGPPLPPVDEAQLIADTDARILANRTAPLLVHVVDADGRPAAGVQVRIEQRRHLFRFGAAFDWGFLQQRDLTATDRRHREAFLRLFNAATVQIYSENYEPEPGLYRDDDVVQAIGWLAAHRMWVDGSPLYWNLTPPRWLAAAAPTEARVREWMDRLLTHASDTFLPRMGSVQVFNEVVAWDRYQSPMSAVLAGGRKVATMAAYLQRLKGLNPRCQTLVNDYDTTPAYYHLLRDLIDAGAPLDAIGLQSHMQSGAWSVTEVWNMLNRLALLHRPIFLTELSVVSGAPREFNFRPASPPWPTTPEGEAAQARYLELFYRLAYSHPAVAGVTYWDYTDRSAWLGCPVGLVRADGSPKPAFQALDRLINQAWHSGGEYRADADGRVELPHAFEGEYRVEAGGYSAEGEHTAARPLSVGIVIGR